MKKDFLVFGIILVLVGFVLLYSSNTSFSQTSYALKTTVDNATAEAQGTQIELGISANFTVGQEFYFNFAPGRFWGKSYDQEFGMEPTNDEFAPNTSIPAYKVGDFYILTPSGDAIDTEVYLVSGTSPFAVVYLNSSKDFLPRLGGNLTLGGEVGIEGVAEQNGTYTVTMYDIEPWVQQNINKQYNISANIETGDPPRYFYLWTITSSQVKPYFVALISAGVATISIGAVSGVWATKSDRKRHFRESKRPNSNKPPNVNSKPSNKQK